MEIYDTNGTSNVQTTYCKKEPASKALAGTALGFGIGGTVLGLLNGGLNLLTGGSRNGWNGSGATATATTSGIAGGYPNITYIGGNTCGNTRVGGCMLDCDDKIELVNSIYQNRITNLQERFDDRQVLDEELFNIYKSQTDADFGLYKSQTDSDFNLYKSQIDADFRLYKGYRDGVDAVNAKHNADAFTIYKSQRDGFDALSQRISDLETKQAINEAVDPWRSKVLQMQINGVAANAQAAINLEAERRCCADNKIVTYVNGTFYPIQVADVTIGTTSTTKQIYNPLCGCCNPCSGFNATMV